MIIETECKVSNYYEQNIYFNKKLHGHRTIMTSGFGQLVDYFGWEVE